MVIYIRYANYLNGEQYLRKCFKNVETAKRWFRKYIAAYANLISYQAIGGFNVVIADVVIRKPV